MSTYKIDNATVTLTNQRVNQVPIPAASREVRTPGLSAIVSIDPAPRPGRVVVSGLLSAGGTDADAALSALYAAIETYSAMQSDGQDHAVIVAKTQYPYCRLAQFNTTGDLQTLPPSNGNITVRAACQWVWQRQTTQTASV